MPEIFRICQYCQKYFFTIASVVKLGRALYCSNDCYKATRVYTPSNDYAVFWSKVKAMPNGCLLWQGTQRKHGYGVFEIAGKAISAHRFAWEIQHGPIPEGMDVLHNCPGGQDNPGCVNAEHLFLGTHQDNMTDKVRKGRQARMPGEKNPLAKLCDDDIRRILALAGSKGQKAIAKEFGITQSNVSLIVRRKTWAHVSYS